MSIRSVNFVQGEYYHIYNRGNSKQKIFHDKYDYFRFTQLLFLANSVNKFNLFNFNKNKLNSDLEFERGKQLVHIGAYCLMPNHFHLLITQIEDSGISKFMQKLTTAYSMYYNKKYDHSGGLFEGKFKSRYLYNDKYLKYIFSYIHLNPIKLIDKNWKEKGINNKNKSLEFLNSYEFSSYIDYLESKNRKNILNRESFPNYFPTNKEFKKEVFEWLNYGENIIP